MATRKNIADLEYCILMSIWAVTVFMGKFLLRAEGALLKWRHLCIKSIVWLENDEFILHKMLVLFWCDDIQWYVFLMFVLLYSVIHNTSMTSGKSRDRYPKARKKVQTNEHIIMIFTLLVYHGAAILFGSL